MKPGTPQHRDLFCRTFVETHVAFEPEQLPWPELDEVHLARLRSIPFWGHARSIERRAGTMVTAFARTLDDPVIRDAVALQGYEEERHGRLMSHLIERYGLEAAEPASEPQPSGAKDEFLVFGFSECADSFVGFGAFAVARKKGLFPESFMTIFEQVLYEEARHITFFINWWRYEEARAGRDRPLGRTLNALRYHLKAIQTTVGTVSNGPPMPKVDASELIDGVSPALFLEAALAENRRVLARLDPRLLRPRLVPRIATGLLVGLRLLPPRREGKAPVGSTR